MPTPGPVTRGYYTDSAACVSWIGGGGQQGSLIDSATQSRDVWEGHRGHTCSLPAWAGGSGEPWAASAPTGHATHQWLPLCDTCCLGIGPRPLEPQVLPSPSWEPKSLIAKPTHCPSISPATSPPCPRHHVKPHGHLLQPHLLPARGGPGGSLADQKGLPPASACSQESSLVGAWGVFRDCAL